MAIYPRTNGRVFNHIALCRNFYDNGALFDPYDIDRVELWRGQYSPETPELLIDTIYGSQVIIHDVSNDAYDVLGLNTGATSTTQVGVLAYEEGFVNQTDFIVTHNLTDSRPNVVVYDTTPQIIHPDEIIALDENTVRIVFAIPQSGTIKIYGTEELCSNTAYTVNKYEMAVVGQDPVTVYHQLNDNDPRVVIYDMNGNFIYPDTITIVDDDTLIVDFGMAFSGTIVVMGGVAGARHTGFGAQPIAISNNKGKFFIYANLNDKLSITVDGVTEVITLTPMPHASVDDIIGMINAQWTQGTAINYKGYIKLQANPYGKTHTMTLNSVLYNGLDDLGFTLGQYDGMGREPAIVEGSMTGLYTIVQNVNDKVKVQVNYNDPITITLIAGVKSIANIVNMLNDAFTLNNYPARAYANSQNKLAIQATTMDGILRRCETGVYYANYYVTDKLLGNGALDNTFKDVWFYKPNESYSNHVPDDTCCFRIYPENYFSSCCFGNYQYDFKLINDQLVKGEIKYIEVGITALPKYDTATINDWLLPICNADYTVYSYGGSLITDWTPVTVNTGNTLRILFDTATIQDGAYKMRVKLRLPDGQILISGWLRLNVIGQCVV
jgi:hypothetical protein